MRRRMSLKSFGDESELIQSTSDDQLYRGKRRSSIYSDESVHSGRERDITEIKTSKGGPIYRRKIIEFEGDGPLGIVFSNSDDILCIKSIMKGSVASEYYELSVGMKVIQIDDISCKYLGYLKSMECLGNLWRMNSYLVLHFEYEDPNDIINDPIHNPIYKFLEEFDLEEYYGDFVELGAKDLEDLNFIESGDLIKMNMPLLKRRSLENKLASSYSNGDDDSDLNKSRLSIHFNPNIVESEKIKELERLKKLHSEKYIIEVVVVGEDV